MGKFNKIELVKNVGSSWFALGMNVLVGLFLSPYILHRLGDEAFGLWVLIFSVTGYYGLFDLGIRSSIIRYVAKYSAVGDNEQLNALINTALIAYGAIGSICLVVTLIGTRYVDAWFTVPASFLTTARWLLLMVGASVALGFPLGVFSGILEGLQRFYLLNSTTVASTIIRAVLIIIALQHGGGLLSVALITVSLPLLTQIVNTFVVLHILPLRFSPRNMDRASMKRIASYSGTTFMIIIATRLRFKTDAIVIGTLLSSAAITYFAIASRLIDYASEVVSSLSQIFIPMSSQSDAQGDSERLQKLLVLGNRACALIIFPITAILAILGKSVIQTWVGAKYVPLSYPVLLILVFSQTLMLAQSASGRILWGLAKHRTLAYVLLAEGAVNLIMSIALVRHYGIVGDAIGTAVPLACTMIFFMPQHVSRIVGLRVTTYLRQAYALPLLLCVPLVITLFLLQHWFYAHTYVQLGLQLSIASAVYGLGLLWALWTHRAWQASELDRAVTGAEAPVGIAIGESFEQEV
jgi:O-antigen/teichoic acid export membrane protein